MEYKLIRAPRKSISITIFFNNEVVIRCPYSASEEEIEDFIESRKKWIDKCLLDNEVRYRINKDIYDYKSIFLQVRKVPLNFGKRNSITQECVTITSLKQIKRLYVSYFKSAFEEFVSGLARNMRVKYNSISFRSYKGKWGCCDSKGNITFNYRIFMLPNYIMRYIVLHELCHLSYFNHSNKFWKRVERFEPDYKNIKEDLKNYDFLTRLY